MDLQVGLGLLEKIRPKNPAINFTGGEPLLHPHLAALVKKSEELGFFPIVVSTNAYEIGPLFEILPMLDNLIISLDSVDEQVNDALCSVPGATQQIIKNIKILAGLRERCGFNITLHAVICDSNIDGLKNLVTFCDSLKLTLSVSPQHMGQYPCRSLLNNHRYAAGIRGLRELKQAGTAITCSDGYLEKIETFAPHSCFPFLSPRVEPDGIVYFPCYRIRKDAFNLKDYGTLYSLMRKRGQWMDGVRECQHRCFLACYMEVEQYVRNPLRLLREMSFRHMTLGKKFGLADKNSPVEV